MSKKNILFVMRENRQVIFESVLQRAHKLGWNIAFYEDHIPRGWQGDGAIIDFLKPYEIQLLPKGLPIATRSSRVYRNAVAYHGDIAHNMRVVFDFFRSRGYRQYAVLNSHHLFFDPVRFLGQLVTEAGFAFHHLYWNCRDGQIIKPESFAHSLSVISDFLRQLPKPCALYVGSSRSIHLIYRACALAKVKIPQDVAIIANTDDPEYGVNISPTVSVLSGELESTGRLLVDGLHRLMKGKPSPDKVQLIPATHIIVRQSTDHYAVEHVPTMQAIEYIQANFGSNQLGLHDLARVACCSGMTLERNFLKYVNRLPSQFIKDIRLEAAARLLEQTDLNLHRIAAKVGYGSNMSFSVAFKGRFGCAPGKYRKQKKASRTRLEKRARSCA